MVRVADDVVSNIVVAEREFTVDGFEFRPLLDAAVCEPGMYFNRADGRYYYDSGFTLTEKSAAPTPEERGTPGSR